MAAKKKTPKPIVRPMVLSYRTLDGNRLKMTSPDASLEDIDMAIKLLQILRSSYIAQADGQDIATPANIVHLAVEKAE